MIIFAHSKCKRYENRKIQGVALPKKERNGQEWKSSHHGTHHGEQDYGAVLLQVVLHSIFGGGTAHLALTDKEHILEAGVEIYIRPPGKKQQSLTLLSGGERALTVIALLLAFLAYHPAPFCLVDEVDAALDEANVERMARYLKNYSGATQFIVITHRRKTMEAANTLLGVTMEEKGVSRLLTVKVDELLKEGI